MTISLFLSLRGIPSSCSATLQSRAHEAKVTHKNLRFLRGPDKALHYIPKHPCHCQTHLVLVIARHTPSLSLRGTQCRSNLMEIATPEPALSGEILPLHFIQGQNNRKAKGLAMTLPPVIARSVNDEATSHPRDCRTFGSQ